MSGYGKVLVTSIVGALVIAFLLWGRHVTESLNSVSSDIKMLKEQITKEAEPKINIAELLRDFPELTPEMMCWPVRYKPPGFRKDITQTVCHYELGPVNWICTSDYGFGKSCFPK